MANILSDYTQAVLDFKDAVLDFNINGYHCFFKNNGDRDIIYARSTTSQGYDIKINGKVCNIVISPANSQKLKKMHADLTSGISYFATVKTSTPEDDYVDCNVPSSENVFQIMASYINNTFGLHVPTS